MGSIPEPGVVLMALSPAGGYLVTVQKPGKNAAGEPIKNLKVKPAAGGGSQSGRQGGLIGGVAVPLDERKRSGRGRSACGAARGARA